MDNSSNYNSASPKVSCIVASMQVRLCMTAIGGMGSQGGLFTAEKSSFFLAFNSALHIRGILCFEYVFVSYFLFYYVMVCLHSRSEVP